MISRFFIDRPVLANVLALVFVLIGLVSLVQLPSAQYPNVVPPTVQVTTRYPGASAATLETAVKEIAPFERRRRAQPQRALGGLQELQCPAVLSLSANPAQESRAPPPPTGPPPTRPPKAGPRTRPSRPP
jgi:hypothetical protein